MDVDVNYPQSMALDVKIAVLNPHCRGSVEIVPGGVRTRARDLQSLLGNGGSCDNRGIMLKKKAQKSKSGGHSGGDVSKPVHIHPQFNLKKFEITMETDVTNDAGYCSAVQYSTMSLSALT